MTTRTNDGKTKIYQQKMVLLFFKIFSPSRSLHFYMRLNQFSKHFSHSDWTCDLNSSTASSGVETPRLRNFFSCAGQNRRHWVPNQGCTADNLSIWHFDRLKIQLFELMRIVANSSRDTYNIVVFMPTNKDAPVSNN